MFIAPTGDPNKDTVALQDALRKCDSVELSGLYALNRTLVIPPTSRIVGNGSLIARLGTADPDDWSVIVEGSQRKCPLSDIVISSSRICRGVLWRSCDNSKLCDELKIMECIGTNAQMDGCWSSQVYGLKLTNGKGVALRMDMCNNVQVHGLFVRVHDVADAAAAVIVTRQDTTQFNNVLFEPVTARDKPAMYLEGSTLRFDTMHFESGLFTDAVIRIHGNGAKRGTNIQFNNISMDQKGNAKTFVECTGITRYISVSNMQVHAWQVTDSVIRLNGGRHYSPQVDRCFTPTIQKAIECSNGAVLIEEPDTLPNPIP